MKGPTIFLIINLVLAIGCIFMAETLFYFIAAFLILEGLAYYFYAKNKENKLKTSS
jgi:hypothetical protein